ncbi:TM2 domain-containing protein [Staphylococcus simulans]|uniref:TM2 domain-containing protein n=1 Tax=Staphylococcus simulans TaxID=1286 RepID=UPI000D1F5E20|nr:TM2 domain-containing protein [Staphylococcus simulans]PTJ09596.1 TM2 domain-containing protein [Staphylococcus simulans]
MYNSQIKQNLSQQELLLLHTEMDKRKKSKGVAFALWLFTGGIGGHRYYMGDFGYAIGMTLTLGGCGIWALIDGFLISGRINEINDQIERELITNLGLGRK